MIDKPNVLIVDDRKENLLALSATLSQLDVNVVESLSGVEALNALMDHEFALVILDVQMPEMDGFEVARLMKNHKKTRDIPIIFVTAISKEQQYVFKGYSSGAVDYISKPFNPEILICKVSVFISLYIQRKLLELKNIELQNSLDKITSLQNEIIELREFIPICSSCYSVRLGSGDWQRFEEYFEAQTESQLSHGLCPCCIKKLYPEYAERILDCSKEENGSDNK